MRSTVVVEVPGPGLEPGWIAPTVFETVASTDSAIRALRQQAPVSRLKSEDKVKEVLPFGQK